MGAGRVSLSVAEAVAADLTVHEVVVAKLTELADICRTTVPNAVLKQDHADWLMLEISAGWPAAVLAGLMAWMPRVEADESCGAYGGRLLAEVSGG